MTFELYHEDDILKLKTLEEINEDFRRGDNINLALLSSDLLSVLVGHYKNEDNGIREMSSRAVVILIFYIKN